MRYFFTSLFIFVFCFCHSQITIDVRNVGAVNDSATLNTAYIQKAIDSVTNNGGGTVLLDGGGVYSSSTLFLRSNVTLRITPGTKLKAPADDAAYPTIPYNSPSWVTYDYTQHSLIFAENESNIRITGGGTIDGNGFQIAYVGLTQHARPFGLRLHKINGLIIDSINLQQAPQWMVHLLSCQNVYINDINVYNQCFGANDGIDIDCCRNVLVENSVFNTNDDCIPVKTQIVDSTCRDITIRNCVMSSYERPVKVGNECFGPVVNVHFSNIVVNASPFVISETPLNAIYVGVLDGGSADSIFIDSIQVNTLYTTPIFVRMDMRDFRYDMVGPAPVPKYLRNVWMTNVNCSGTTIPSSISGVPGYDVQNIYLGNINVTVPGGGPAVTGNLPELTTTRAECNMWGDSLPAYGLFVWHENGLYIDKFCVTLDSPDVRPEYYFIDTANIPAFQNAGGCTKNYNGINKIAENDIHIYPNPANNMLSITNMPEQAEAVVIYSLTGERISVVPTLRRQNLSFSVSNLQTGVYIVNFLGNNYSENRRVVIVK